MLFALSLFADVGLARFDVTACVERGTEPEVSPIEKKLQCSSVRKLKKKKRGMRLHAPYEFSVIVDSCSELEEHLRTLATPTLSLS